MREKKIKSMPPSEEKEYEVNQEEKGTRNKRNGRKKKTERTRGRENNRFYIQSKVTFRDDHHYTTHAASYHSGSERIRPSTVCCLTSQPSRPAVLWRLMIFKKIFQVRTRRPSGRG